jgi:hypothetical protein
MTSADRRPAARLDVLRPLLGVWLMASPAVLGFDGAARVDALAVGPLLAAAGIISLSAITRGIRWLAVPLGAWLVLAPAWMPHTAASAVNSVVVGALAAGLAFLPVRNDERFGGGWRALWTSSDARDAGARAPR